MQVSLENLSRNFGPQPVIKNLSYRFEAGETYAVLGGNGSGKSTLLKMILGALTPTSGSVRYHLGGKVLKPEEIPFLVSLAGPYLELIEELTALEFLVFFQKFRSFKDGAKPAEILERIELKTSAHKEIRNFSSGMKQRLRLGLALFTDSALVLLDEPTANLDPAGVKFYQQLMKDQLGQRTLIVGSNFSEEEIFCCQHQLPLAPAQSR